MNPTVQSGYFILQVIAWIVLFLSTLYIFVFALAGLFYRQRPYAMNPNLRKIAILIPGYKEDEVIIEVAKDALNQDYPPSLYDVVIIADSFQPETIEKLKKLPIKVIEVNFDKSTKSKALNKAMEQLDGSYEIALVLDADNVMEDDFLVKINAAFEQNYMAVQGHRKAKNLNNSMAILDAISEAINNHIFRKGHSAIGLSSGIVGSGMAFKYDFFKELMSTVKAIGGFDKEIELKMFKAGHKIAYLNDACIYDEKVQSAEVFSNQRRRWLSAQLHYFRQNFLDSFKDFITKGNLNYFDKSIQLIQLPRILLLGAVLFFGIFFPVTNLLLDIKTIFTILWGIVVATCIFAFLFSIPLSFYNIKTINALGSLPKSMILMLKSLFKIRGANQSFIHTKHTSTTTNK